MLNLMVAWPGALFASHMLGDGGGGGIEGWGGVDITGAWLRAQVRHAVAAYFAPLAWGAGVAQTCWAAVGRWRNGR